MLVPPTTVDFSIVLCYICFSLLYEPALYIDNDRHSDAMVISQSTDKKFGTPRKLLNTCIPNTRFILLSITAKSVITVVVGAQPHDSYLLKQIWKKFKQSKRDTRVHIIEAIDSLKAALKERFEKSEHNLRCNISETIKSLEETLAENSIKSKQYTRSLISNV